MSRSRLFIPGPVEVHPDVLAAGSTPMIGHRTPEYRELHGRVVGKLDEVLAATRSHTLMFTCSATGLMEAGVRNLIRERALFLVAGAFAERWHKIAESCGKQADAVTVEWGQAVTPAMVTEAMQNGSYDTVALVHNETSTGVMHDLAGIARAVRDAGGDDVCFMVDAVTSMTAVPTPVDSLDIDLCFAGSQKALAMPPGLTVATVSPRALARADSVPGRGFYFDLVQAVKSAEKRETPSTPAISLIYSLDASLDLMLTEGMQARYTRHRELARLTRGWAKERFALLPAEEDCSITLTVIENTRSMSRP